MKTILMVLAAQWISVGLYAQSAATRSNVNVKTSGYNVMVNITDKDGKPFVPDMEVQGTPFFKDDNWQQVNLATANGKAFANIKAKVNLHQATLHFINGKGVEMYLEASEISRIEILDSANPKQINYTFIKLTNTNKAGMVEHNLYQVLAEGKVKLLKLLRKKVQVYTQEYSKEITRTFEEYESYHVFANNELQTVKRKESFWETLLQDQWKAVQAYAGSNNLGFKSYDDIAKLVTYYNTL
jgi:hypothetical protein